MNKFKLKKIKVTKSEKITILSLLLLIASLYLLYPLNISDKIVSYSSPEANNSLKNFVFEGSFQRQTTFEDKYVNAIYTLDDKTISYFINLETGEVVDYLGFVKDQYEEEFHQKIYELLTLKYPKKIADILHSSAKKTYIFNETYLTINYEVKEQLNSERNFALNVFYNEIEKYLEFTTVKVDDPLTDDGYNYDPSKISVAFTFDDGPNGKRTQKLIDALEDYKMSATFFIVASKINSDQESVKKVYDSHSEVGYHSLDHKYFTKQSVKTIQDEFKKADDDFNALTGGHFALTRPPYGAYNQKTLDAINTPFIRWDLDTNDWQYKDVEYIKKYVLENYQDGSIILFHDSYDTSVEAAISLMETFYNLDVQVVSVSQLAKLKGITLENHEIYYTFTK